MSRQRTSSVKPVSDGLARQIGRMFEDFARGYPGGGEKLELVKGDPDLEKAIHRFFDEQVARRAQTLLIADRPPWKTIKLGTHQSTKELRQALIDAGCKIGSWGDDALKRITVAQEPTEIELVIVTVAELGFPDGATRAEIYKKALSLDLDLCPAEVGPQLRLQYQDQRDEWLLLAMEPITDSDGHLVVFGVAHVSGSRCLRAVYGGGPGYFWGGDDRWVFCRK